MKYFPSIPQFELYLRIAGWFLLLLNFADVVGNTSTFFFRVINNLWLVLFLLVVNYILFEYSIPFVTGRWYKALLAPLFILIHLLLNSFGLYAWRLLGITLGIYFDFMQTMNPMQKVTGVASYGIPSIIFFGVVRHIYRYLTLKQTAEQLQIEKKEAELQYLRSQINPHFLFNTLNNIYALTLEKSTLAPESVLRLSQILRFMLYETDGVTILIEQEMSIIEHYIALEKLRYDESLRVEVHQTPEQLHHSIPPLLLIPLVENAFKHGVSETRHNPFITMSLSIEQEYLTFTVMNSTDETPDPAPIKPNIGLSNVQRRLELLFTESSLIFHREQTTFSATLSINLRSHV